MFIEKDFQVAYYGHNRPLYVEVKDNEVYVKKVLVDNEAFVNLMPIATYNIIKYREDIIFR